MTLESLDSGTVKAADGAPSAGVEAAARPARVTSIDALRGFVMFAMIFVNDLGDAPGGIVPDWMVHYSARHSKGGSGMTFVDLVFPGFLFIVGMSIPFGLGSRLGKGGPPWKTLLHVIARTVFLLIIGIMMVNETPDSAQLGWPGALWCTLMYLSAMLAFCEFASSRKSDTTAKRSVLRIVSLGLHALGFASLLWLAFAFRDGHGRAII